MGQDLAHRYRAAALRHQHAADVHAEKAVFFRGAGAVAKAENEEWEARFDREAAARDQKRADRAERRVQS
jgi:hypothetical protein